MHFIKLKIRELVNPGYFISEDNINSNPFEQFTKWYKKSLVRQRAYYDAMTLSTATPEGIPSARMVLLKSYDEKGFVFFSNSSSRKGKEIEANPNAALTFFWNKTNKQVRIEGILEQIDDNESDEYFSTRPVMSRLGAWASIQSSVISDRKYLLNRLREYEYKFKDAEIPRPPYWVGFRLIPAKIEFWQARANRLHDRFLFTKDNNKWKYVRLSP